MTFEVLIPTYDDLATSIVVSSRLDSLAGKTVGLVSNGKLGTIPFFDEVERSLREEHGVADVVRTTKGNYSAPAGSDIMGAASTWHALIAGIGD